MNALPVLIIGLIAMYIIPNLASAQNISTIKPGFLPDYFCQEYHGPTPSYSIVNGTGFFGVYHLYYGHRMIYDYVLQPGHNGTMFYMESTGSSGDITGNFQFFHDDMQESHQGINIQSVPINTTSNAYSKIVISTTSDANLGAYWVVFPPDFCDGGSVILLTIGQSLELIPPTGSLNAHVENHSPDYVIVMDATPYDMANLTISDQNGIKQLNEKIIIDPNGESARWFTPNQNGNYTAVITNVLGNVTVPFTASGVENNLQNAKNSDTGMVSPSSSGNESIPEFPLAIPILLVSIVLLMVLTRMPK